MVCAWMGDGDSYPISLNTRSSGSGRLRSVNLIDGVSVSGISALMGAARNGVDGARRTAAEFSAGRTELRLQRGPGEERR